MDKATAAGMTKRYVVFPCELGDGVNSFTHDPAEGFGWLADALANWLEEADANEELGIRLVELTPEEFERLPDQ